MFASPHALTALILAFFYWMLYIGYRTHTGHNKAELRENFLIGNRGVSAWLVSIGALMGWLDATSFGFVPALGFDMGYAALIYIPAAAVVIFGMSYFAGGIREHAHKNQSYMIGNFFGRHLSPRCAVLVGLVSSIYFTLWLSMQFAIGGKLLETLTGFSFLTVVLAMGTVTLVYMLLGGFLASIRTDFIQFLICLPFFAILYATVVPHLPTLMPPLAEIRNTNPWDWINIAILNGVSTLVAPDLWQRIYSARSPQEASSSLRRMAFLIMVFLSIFTLLGVIIRHNNLAADSSNLAPAVFAMLPTWFLPFLVITFMAAVMSTIATTLFGAAMVLASDVVLELKWISKTSLQTLARLLMLIILPSAIIIASLPIDIITLGFTCLGVTLVVVPLAAALLLGMKVNDSAAFYTLLLNLLAFFAGSYHGIFTGPLGTLPLLLSTGTLLLFEGLTRTSTPHPKRKK